VLRLTATAPPRTPRSAWWVTLLSLAGVPLGLLLVMIAPTDPVAMGPFAALGTGMLGLATVALGISTRGVMAPVACCASFLATIWLCLPAERLVFVSDRDTPGRPQIFAVGAAGGSPDRLTASGGQDSGPTTSSTGRLAFTRREGDRERIMLADDQGSGAIPLPGGEGHDHHPAWSPDGRWLAFASDRGGDWDVYVVASDGTQLRDLTRHPGHDDWPTWSPDGRRLAFASDRGGQSRIFIVDSDGGGTIPFVGGDTPASEPAWSPDGRRLAFVSGEREGETQVCSALIDGGQRRCLTSPGRYTAPSWSPSGDRLAYIGGGHVFVIPASGGTARDVSRDTSTADTPTWTRSGPMLLSRWVRQRPAN
jgi:Tol biopolymer transport system component